MEKTLLLFVGLSLSLASLILIGDWNHVAKSDTGWEGAQRVDNGGSINTPQILVPPSGGTPVALVTASTKNLCVQIHNLDNNYTIFVGSFTTVTTTTGFAITVSTSSAGTLILSAFRGNIYGISSAPTFQSTATVLTCQQ